MPNRKLPIVAIVGRTNAGKSSMRCRARGSLRVPLGRYCTGKHVHIGLDENGEVIFESRRNHNDS